MKVGIIIVAGGKGTRMGHSMPKQFMNIKSRAILVRTLERFAQVLPSSEIVVVLNAEMIDLWQELVKNQQCKVIHKVCPGGSERFHSVKNGLAQLSCDVDLIAVHDGVRPLVSAETILAATKCAQLNGSAIPAIDAVDSCRIIDGDTSCISDEFRSSHPVDRSTLKQVQTPQMFKTQWIRQAYELDYQADFTDDASVVEKLGKKIYLCQGDRNNIKITSPLDLKLAELILDEQEF